MASQNERRVVCIHNSETTINWYIWPYIHYTHTPCVCVLVFGCMKKAYVIVYLSDRWIASNSNARHTKTGFVWYKPQIQTTVKLNILWAIECKECELIRWKDWVKGTGRNGMERVKGVERWKLWKKEAEQTSKSNGRICIQASKFECSESAKEKWNQQS